MKKIIDLCQKEAPAEIVKIDPLDLVKLRLRGRGSGYKEGNTQEGFFPFFKGNNCKNRVKRPSSFVCEFTILRNLQYRLQIRGRAFEAHL